jgi:hypothetical protein
MSSGAVCRHLKIAGRLTFFTVSSGYQPPRFKVETHPLQYLHRLDLLPGSYRIAIRIDGKTSYYPLEVPAKPPVSDIILAAETPGNGGHETLFEFGSAPFYPSSDCKFAVLALLQPGDVTWVIRRGLQVVWRKRMQSTGSVAVLPLPFDSLTPGKFELEATADGVTRRTDLELREKPEDKRTLVSFNANLSKASRNALAGHEWLLRGDTRQSLYYLQAAIQQGAVKEAQVDLARIDALTNHWDQARDRLRDVLSEDPNNFDGLCVFAYVEAELQDYSVAAEYYRRALAVQDSPIVRLALARLPR